MQLTREGGAILPSQGGKGVPCGDVVKVTIEITNNSNRTVVVDGPKGSNIKQTIGDGKAVKM